MKACPICNQELKDNDVVVALLLARYRPKESAYDLECMSQTIASHVFCVEAPKVKEETK